MHMQRDSKLLVVVSSLFSFSFFFFFFFFSFSPFRPWPVTRRVPFASMGLRHSRVSPLGLLTLLSGHSFADRFPFAATPVVRVVL
ncbi:hypothetical protein BDV37DRAFT_260751 [Aspergillus pseudonomiae]|uniref:Uncharacterized protein n=1 Tax=Aspergillus pseudonomiae TaxID=1506151 RepID=A0A5N7CYV7_9EURO|nr:uncharacterized protein BDV37DRAFT_260751 [Aspergillus pseudonomiae]KAE8399374.1 hypothetical protein BDV37DRAFT_260751 [Aspergillus pseudonomiae]